MENLPEVMAAMQCTALFCAEQENWPLFEAWLRDKNAVLSGDSISREMLIGAYRTFMLLLREVETELLIARAAGMIGG